MKKIYVANLYFLNLRFLWVDLSLIDVRLFIYIILSMLDKEFYSVSSMCTSKSFHKYERPLIRLHYKMLHRFAYKNFFELKILGRKGATIPPYIYLK